MATKTYGIISHVSWQVAIPVGKARLVVEFTGGAQTPYGVIPAEYTTSNKIHQTIIENSEFYKNGRISLLREIGDTDSNNKDNAKAIADEELKSDDKVLNVEVSCLTDAQNYLKDNFGISNSKARNKELALKYGAENGVEFIFAE